jgi:hypothetical protein
MIILGYRLFFLERAGEWSHNIAMRTALAIVLAIVIGFPGGWMVAMLLTPVLWKLEPILHMELAGHSGPSDWIFCVVWALIIPGLFLLLRFTVLRPPKTGMQIPWPKDVPPR